MMSDKIICTICKRKHTSRYGTPYHFSFVYQLPEILKCSKCDGWGEHRVDGTTIYTNSGSKPTSCMKCLKTSIPSIPLSEFK